MSHNKESDSRHVYNFMHDTGLIRASDDQKTRHEYKTLAEGQGLSTSTEKASFVPLTNQRTIDDYKNVLKEFRHFARVEGYGDNLRTLPASAATAFCNHKILDDGIGRGRINDICSIINKAGYFGHNSELNSAVAAFRRDVLPSVPASPAVSRAFSNPEAVISALKPPAALAGEIQLRTGLRAENALSFKINEDGKTVSFVSKGGMQHPSFPMPQDLIERARAYEKNGVVSIMPYRTYSYQVSAASNRLGERVEVAGGKTRPLNSHAFRHCYARNLYHELTGRGVSDIDAKAKVSEALFHQRLEIVAIYIR